MLFFRQQQKWQDRDIRETDMQSQTYPLNLEDNEEKQGDCG